MFDTNNVYKIDKDCKFGSLPGRAPLAVPYVPFQDENPPIYSANDGLNRGTVFPGLDLPWMNTVNESNPEENTLLGDLTALEFAVDDMQLYMDTHENDTEVFRVLQYFIKEADACRREYVKTYGPVSRDELLDSEQYDWLKGPWPWEYREGM